MTVIRTCDAMDFTVALVSQSDKAFGMALEYYEMLKDIQTYNKESVD